MDACIVVEIKNESVEESLVIDSTHGRRVIPPAQSLRLTLQPTTIYVLRAERMTDPQGVLIP